MNKPTQESRQKLVFRFAFFSALLTLIVVIILIGFQVYVRWFFSKDFSLLGGFELEMLTASAFVLILGMVYAYRPATEPHQP